MLIPFELGVGACVLVYARARVYVRCVVCV